MNVVVNFMLMVVFSFFDMFIKGYKFKNFISIKLLISMVLINNKRYLVIVI